MIFYFSGTGNSFWVTRTIAANLNDSNIVEIGNALIGEQLHLSVRPAERIGFVFPVHCWGIPWLVRKFISELVIDGYANNLIYCVLTCGDDCGYTDKMFKRLISRKGWQCRHIYSVQMPNTYIVLPGFNTDPIELEKEKKEKAVATLQNIIKAITSDMPIKCYLTKNHLFLKSRILYPLFCRFMMSSKPFYTTNKCNGCGLCAKLCPVSNIKLIDTHPQWGNTCTQCLSCLHHCPVEAIEYGKQTIGKKRYFYNKRR